MADNFNRSAINGPLLVTGSANTSTVLEFGVRSGIPLTADMDANPYTTSGQTRKALLVSTAGGAVSGTTLLGSKVALTFLQQNLTTSLSASAMKISDVSGVTQVAMPFAGSVVGVAGCFNANVTAGTCRLAVSVNGATVFSAINAATSIKVISGTQAIGTDTFNAGDRIGVKLTTSATFAPTTDDLTAIVIVTQ